MIWLFAFFCGMANAASNPVADAVEQVGFCKSSVIADEISIKVKAAQVLSDPSQCAKVEWSPALDQQLLKDGYELTSFLPTFLLPSGRRSYHQFIESHFEYSKTGQPKKSFTNSCELSYSAKVYLHQHPVEPCALSIYRMF